MSVDIIQELRKKYIELPDYREETVKIRVVIPFLEMLGYREDWYRFEYPVIKKKKVTDITILRNGKIDMVVEVKKGGNYSIKAEDIHQLLTYLVIKNVEWGIVTNGRDYILINSKIGELKDKEVLKFNLLDLTNENKMIYFTFDSIFQNKITTYFKHLAQFKYYKLQENNNYTSWSIYNSTITNYFNYLISKNENYRKLEYLSREDFKEFINYDINQSQTSKTRLKKINSKQTIINKYRHIKKLYELFVLHNEINHNPFSFITEEEMIDGVEGIKLESDDYFEHISLEMIEEILALYDNSRNSERNKIIFLLCLYAGLGRDEIRYIKIDDFNYLSNTLKVKDIELPMPKNFINRIKNYIENVRNKNAKVEYLFDSNYGDYAGEPLSRDMINTTINRNSKHLKDFSPDDKTIKVKPENIRKLLVRKFFENGFSIEEIVTITGMELQRIAEHITTAEIIDRTIIKSLPDNHPYLNLFEKS
ncbi:hypothetical protein UACE39S_01729 [Ureibacillus acetophenoni]